MQLNIRYNCTDLEGAHEGLIYTHHCAGIVEFAAVIWCREDGDKLALGKELVAILHHLHRHPNH